MAGILDQTKSKENINQGLKRNKEESKLLRKICRLDIVWTFHRLICNDWEPMKIVEAGDVSCCCCFCHHSSLPQPSHGMMQDRIVKEVSLELRTSCDAAAGGLRPIHGFLLSGCCHSQLSGLSSLQHQASSMSLSVLPRK